MQIHACPSAAAARTVGLARPVTFPTITTVLPLINTTLLNHSHPSSSSQTSTFSSVSNTTCAVSPGFNTSGLSTLPRLFRAQSTREILQSNSASLSKAVNLCDLS
eukprot:266457-Rhodomonas_salina.1